jgi:hypothetical protein
LIYWYSKRQATEETTTFGSEFTATRIAVGQIIDLRTTLRYLGVPVNAKSIMIGGCHKQFNPQFFTEKNIIMHFPKTDYVR